MYKIVILTTVFLNACASFTINGTICDNIGTGSDKNMQNMPAECRDYDEKKADKAFHKVIEDKKVSKKDIEFDKDKE